MQQEQMRAVMSTLAIAARTCGFVMALWLLLMCSVSGALRLLHESTLSLNPSQAESVQQQSPAQNILFTACALLTLVGQAFSSTFATNHSPPLAPCPIPARDCTSGRSGRSADEHSGARAVLGSTLRKASSMEGRSTIQAVPLRKGGGGGGRLGAG